MPYYRRHLFGFPCNRIVDRSESIAIRKRSAFLIGTLALFASIFSGHAAAQEIGACVSKAGSLSDVTIGSVPSCTGNKTPISWNAEGPEGSEGPEGPPGPPGPAGSGATPEEVIVGPAGELRSGPSAGSNGSRDCLTTYGEGARWATTRDLRDLSWSPTATLGFGWINFHPISYDTVSGIYTDISGYTGLITDLACGKRLSAALNVPWLDNPTDPGKTGLVAFGTESSPSRIDCDVQLPAICVAPAVTEP